MYNKTYIDVELLDYFKQKLHHKYIMEGKILKVTDPRYPEGIKYSLIFIELETGRKVLIDNHHPKSHHLHLDDKEYKYDFATIEKLKIDFRRIVFEHFGEKI